MVAAISNCIMLSLNSRILFTPFPIKITCLAFVPADKEKCPSTKMHTTTDKILLHFIFFSFLYVEKYNKIILYRLTNNGKDPVSPSTIKPKTLFFLLKMIFIPSSPPHFLKKQGYHRNINY